MASLSDIVLSKALVGHDTKSLSRTCLKFPNKGFLKLTLTKVQKDVRKMDLSKNALTDLKTIENCPSLTFFKCAENSLKGKSIKPCRSLVELTVLNLMHNKISKLPTLTPLVRLKALVLTGNRLSDISAVATISSLEHLVVSHNKLKTIPISVLKALPNLVKVAASHNQLTEVPNFSGNAKLVEVKLNTNLIKEVPNTCLPFKVLSQLKLLDIGNNQIDSWKDISIKNLASLKNLNLKGNPVAVTNWGCNSNDVELANGVAATKYKRDVKKRFPLLHILDGRPCSNMHQERISRRREFRVPGTGEKAETQRLRKEKQNEKIQSRKTERQLLIKKLAKEGKVKLKQNKFSNRNKPENKKTGSKSQPKFVKSQPKFVLAEKKLIKKELKKLRKRKKLLNTVTNSNVAVSDATVPDGIVSDTTDVVQKKMSRAERRRLRAIAHRSRKTSNPNPSSDSGKVNMVKKDVKSSQVDSLKVNGIENNNEDSSARQEFLQRKEKISNSDRTKEKSTVKENATHQIRNSTNNDDMITNDKNVKISTKRKASVGWQNAINIADKSTKRAKINDTISEKSKSSCVLDIKEIGTRNTSKKKSFDYTSVGSLQVGDGGGGVSAW